MKTFRSLAVLLLATALAQSAPAQESSEVTALRAKAEKGNGIAQYNLGLAYADGKGVARDPVEAFVWLSLARENGARGRALDNVAAALDKAAMETARQRIAEHKAALGMTSGTPRAQATPAAPRAPVEQQAAPAAAPGEDPAVVSLRNERDVLAARANSLAGDLAELRNERDRLAKLAGDNEKGARAATEAQQAAQARVAELVRANDAAKSDLARAQQALTALEQAPKPAPDNSALEAKSRELSAALAELEAARQFGRQVEDTLNKVNDDRARVAASAAAELEAARQFGQQVEATLNKVNDQKAALETQLAAVTRAKAAAEQALAAKPAAPAYPDLSNRVGELEAALAASRNATPPYPDLRARVTELETQFAALSAEASRAKQEIAALTKAKEEKPVAPKYPDLSGRVAELEKQLAAKPAAPAYPDLSNRVSELEAALQTARNAAPAYPDLRGRVAELEKIASAKPAYPDLSGKVTELETGLASAQRQADDTATRLAAAQAEAEQLRARPMSTAPAYPDLSNRVADLEKQLAAKPSAPAYPDLSGRVAELETALADTSRQLVAAQNAKPAAPAYPDLSGRVAELEAAVATSIQKFGAAEQARAEISRQFDDYKSATAAAQRERTTLTASLKMLESDKAALRRQVEAATTESNQLRTQVAALKTQAAAPKNIAPAYPNLSGKVAELETKLASAEKSAADLSAEAASAKQQVAVLTKAQEEKPAAPAYPDLSGKMAELGSEVTQLRADRERMQKLLADLSSEATRAKQDVVALTKAKEEATAANRGRPVAPPDYMDRMRELVTGLTAERDAARRAQNELRDTVAKLTQENAGLVAAKPAVPAYPDLTNRVGELENQLTRANSELSAVASAKADLSGRVAELETKLASAEKSAAELSAEAASAKQQVAVLTKAQEEKPAAPAYPDLSGRVSELEAAAAESARRLIAAEAARTGLQQQLAEAAATAQNTAKAAGDSTQLRRERDEMSGKVTNLSGEVAQLRTDRERMVKMLADAGRQMRDTTADSARIKELETQLAALGSEAARAKQEIAALALAKEAAQSQSGGLTSERDAARSALNELRDTIARLEREKAELASAKPIQTGAPAYPDLSGRVRELEAQLAALPRGQAAPAYPDLTGRVGELEAALTATKQQLAAASAAAAPAATTGDTGALEQKLADTEGRLATALRGYATLQRERDALAENAAKSAAAVTAERDALAGQVASLTGQVEQLRASAQSSSGSTQAELARLSEAVATLQRTSTQASRDAATARALAQQLQGANTVLAGENYQLKTMLARSTGGAAPVAAPVTVPAVRTHVVAAGDSLSRLSQRYYGTPGRWQEIYNANAALLGPNGVLRVGTELRIP